MNIPIYRAKKIDSDEYVMGMLTKRVFTDYLLIRDDINTNLSKIDPTTLAIHFSDMLDSKGNKIFASLSEDGKGGDILYYEDDCQPYICEHSSDGTFLFEYLDDKTIKNYICRLSGNKVLFEDLKAIGIQE
jgi:hypothetical protein